MLREAAGSDAVTFTAGFLRRHPKIAAVFQRKQLHVLDGPVNTHRGEAWQEGERKILLGPKFWHLSNNKDRDAVLAHEVGHAVLAQFGLSNLVKLAQEQGVDVWDQPSLPYGNGNMDEAFADSFAEYFLNHAELVRRYPAWVPIIETALR